MFTACLPSFSSPFLFSPLSQSFIVFSGLYDSPQVCQISVFFSQSPMDLCTRWPLSRQQIGNVKSRSWSQIATSQAEIMCVNKLRCHLPPKRDFILSNRKVRHVSRVDSTHVLCHCIPLGKYDHQLEGGF